MHPNMQNPIANDSSANENDRLSLVQAALLIGVWAALFGLGLTLLP